MKKAASRLISIVLAGIMLADPALANISTGPSVLGAQCSVLPFTTQALSGIFLSARQPRTLLKVIPSVVAMLGAYLAMAHHDHVSGLGLFLAAGITDPKTKSWQLLEAELAIRVARARLKEAEADLVEAKSAALSGNLALVHGIEDLDEINVRWRTTPNRGPEAESLRRDENRIRTDRLPALRQNSRATFEAQESAEREVEEAQEKLQDAIRKKGQLKKRKRTDQGNSLTQKPIGSYTTPKMMRYVVTKELLDSSTISLSESSALAALLKPGPQSRTPGFMRAFPKFPHELRFIQRMMRGETVQQVLKQVQAALYKKGRVPPIHRIDIHKIKSMKDPTTGLPLPSYGFVQDGVLHIFIDPFQPDNAQSVFHDIYEHLIAPLDPTISEPQREAHVPHTLATLAETAFADSLYTTRARSQLIKMPLGEPGVRNPPEDPYADHMTIREFIAQYEYVKNDITQAKFPPEIRSVEINDARMHYALAHASELHERAVEIFKAMHQRMGIEDFISSVDVDLVEKQRQHVAAFELAREAEYKKQMDRTGVIVELELALTKAFRDANVTASALEEVLPTNPWPSLVSTLIKRVRQEAISANPVFEKDIREALADALINVVMLLRQEEGGPVKGGAGPRGPGKDRKGQSRWSEIQKRGFRRLEGPSERRFNSGGDKAMRRIGQTRKGPPAGAGLRMERVARITGAIDYRFRRSSIFFFLQRTTDGTFFGHRTSLKTWEFFKLDASQLPADVRKIRLTPDGRLLIDTPAGRLEYNHWTRNSTFRPLTGNTDTSEEEGFTLAIPKSVAALHSLSWKDWHDIARRFGLEVGRFNDLDYLIQHVAPRIETFQWGKVFALSMGGVLITAPILASLSSAAPFIQTHAMSLLTALVYFSEALFFGHMHDTGYVYLDQPESGTWNGRMILHLTEPEESHPRAKHYIAEVELKPSDKFWLGTKTALMHLPFLGAVGGIWLVQSYVSNAAGVLQILAGLISVVLFLTWADRTAGSLHQWHNRRMKNPGHSGIALTLPPPAGGDGAKDEARDALPSASPATNSASDSPAFNPYGVRELLNKPVVEKMFSPRVQAFLAEFADIFEVIASGSDISEDDIHAKLKKAGFTDDELEQEAAAADVENLNTLLELFQRHARWHFPETPVPTAEVLSHKFSEELRRGILPQRDESHMIAVYETFINSLERNRDPSSTQIMMGLVARLDSMAFAKKAFTGDIQVNQHALTVVADLHQSILNSSGVVRAGNKDDKPLKVSDIEWEAFVRSARMRIEEARKKYGLVLSHSELVESLKHIPQNTTVYFRASDTAPLQYVYLSKYEEFLNGRIDDATSWTVLKEGVGLRITRNEFAPQTRALPPAAGGDGHELTTISTIKNIWKLLPLGVVGFGLAAWWVIGPWAAIIGVPAAGAVLLSLSVIPFWIHGRSLEEWHLKEQAAIHLASWWWEAKRLTKAGYFTFLSFGFTRYTDKIRFDRAIESFVRDHYNGRRLLWFADTDQLQKVLVGWYAREKTSRRIARWAVPVILSGIYIFLISVGFELQDWLFQYDPSEGSRVLKLAFVSIVGIPVLHHFLTHEVFHNLLSPHSLTTGASGSEREFASFQLELYQEPASEFPVEEGAEPKNTQKLFTPKTKMGKALSRLSTLGHKPELSDWESSLPVKAMTRAMIDAIEYGVVVINIPAAAAELLNPTAAQYYKNILGTPLFEQIHFKPVAGTKSYFMRREGDDLYLRPMSELYIEKGEQPATEIKAPSQQEVEAALDIRLRRLLGNQAVVFTEPYVADVNGERRLLWFYRQQQDKTVRFVTFDPTAPGTVDAWTPWDGPTFFNETNFSIPHINPLFREYRPKNNIRVLSGGPRAKTAIQNIEDALAQARDARNAAEITLGLLNMGETHAQAVLEGIQAKRSAAQENVRKQTALVADLEAQRATLSIPEVGLIDSIKDGLSPFTLQWLEQNNVKDLAGIETLRGTFQNDKNPTIKSAYKELGVILSLFTGTEMLTERLNRSNLLHGAGYYFSFYALYTVLKIRTVSQLGQLILDPERSAAYAKEFNWSETFVSFIKARYRMYQQMNHRLAQAA